jgi:hypothetical protein
VNRCKLLSCLIVCAVVWQLSAASAQAELVNYYVAIDSAANEPLWSAYNDPDGDGVPETVRPNPNQGRLTFLYAHPIPDNPSSNHFHTVGRYAYTGSLSNPTITNLNEYSFWSGNVLIQGLPGHNIPEQFGDLGETVSPLPLLTTDGLYSGKLTTIPGGVANGHYANMEIRSTADLALSAPGTPEHYMLHSLEPYGEDYDDSLAGVTVAIELLDITPGLHVGSPSVLEALQAAGDTTVIGTSENFSFTPVFWTEGNATPGIYSATMRLVDLRTSGEAFLPSGAYTFSFSVNPVPEPTSIVLLLGGGLLGVMNLRRRK